MRHPGLCVTKAEQGKPLRARGRLLWRAIVGWGLQPESYSDAHAAECVTYWMAPSAAVRPSETYIAACEYTQGEGDDGLYTCHMGAACISVAHPRVADATPLSPAVPPSTIAFTIPASIPAARRLFGRLAL